MVEKFDFTKTRFKKVELSKSECQQPAFNKHRFTASLLVIGMMALPGCAPNTASMQINNNAQDENAVVAHKLGRILEVKQIKGEFINGLYRARVIVANRKRSTQNLQYQFSWYDNSGAEVGVDGNGWTPFMINGKDEKTIVGLAPNPQSSGFRINVRDLKANKTFKTNFFGKM